MTHIVELRKQPRPANPAPEGPSSRTRQIPSAHISSYLLKILGLKSAEPHPEEL
jgi:hypothetical protein